MERHYAESCLACIGRFLGPALIETSPEPVTTDRCGGCGEVKPKHRATYWFPYPEEEPDDPPAPPQP